MMIALEIFALSDGNAYSTEIDLLGLLDSIKNTEKQ